MPVPNGWSDDGTSLHNPQNDKIVTLGNRLHILRMDNWDENNIPLTDEVYTDIPQLSNPAKGNGSYQVFMNTLLVWTKSTGVNEIAVGFEILAAHIAIDSLRNTSLAEKMQVFVSSIISSLDSFDTTVKSIPPQAPGGVTPVTSAVLQLVLDFSNALQKIQSGTTP